MVIVTWQKMRAIITHHARFGKRSISLSGPLDASGPTMSFPNGVGCPIRRIEKRFVGLPKL